MKKTRYNQSMMGKFLHPLGRIRWQLAAIYMFTSLCVFFSTEWLLTVINTRQAFQSDGFVFSLYKISSQQGMRLLPFLTAETIDREGLQSMIDQSFPFIDAPGPNDGVATGTEFQPQRPPENALFAIPSLSTSYSAAKSTITIIDTNGVIQASSQADVFPTGENLSDHLTSIEAAFLEAAYTQLFFNDIPYLYSDASMLSLAVPVIDRVNVVGWMYLQIYPPSFRELLVHAIDIFIPRIPVLLLIAALVGLFFGYLSARSITRRLERITATAARWGQGDFAPRIHEQQHDEISELTHDLDVMADEFEQLLESKEQLAMLEERNRLARELHDSVKQQLFAVNMTLAAVAALWKKQPDQAIERLDVSRKLAQQAQDELSALIQTLRPVELRERKLIAAIQEYLQDWERQTKIAAVLELEGEGKLSTETEQAAYRIFQEALSNVARHSKATAVSLSIRYSKPIMEMTIHDNGHGFNIDSANQGIGLASMRERCESAQGSFELTSTENGTRIRARFPIESNEESVSDE